MATVRLIDKPIHAQLRLLTFLAAGALTIFALIGAFRARSDAHNAFVRETEHMVESGTGIIKLMDSRVKEGALTLEQAQAQALEALKGMRYGEGDYLYVSDKANICICIRSRPSWWAATSTSCRTSRASTTCAS